MPNYVIVSAKPPYTFIATLTPDRSNAELAPFKIFYREIAVHALSAAMQFAEELATEHNARMLVDPIALASAVNPYDFGTLEQLVVAVNRKCSHERKLPNYVWYPPMDVVESVIALVLADEQFEAYWLLANALKAAKCR